MGIACLTNYFNKVIDTYGTDITLRVVTVTSTNERGDPTLSNADTTVKARVETSNGAKIKEMVGYAISALSIFSQAASVPLTISSTNVKSLSCLPDPQIMYGSCFSIALRINAIIACVSFSQGP